MKTLREVIKEAESRRSAVGHFNISNIESLRGIFDAARELELPVIIGVSEGERRFIGVRQTVALVRSLREEFEYPIFLNADHTYTFEGVREAVDAGFDAVIFDGAKLSLEENIAATKQCVEYARQANPEVIVEGELGYIGASSELFDKLPEGAAMSAATFTKPEDAARFVAETGVDFFAPAVGNIHGMLRGAPNPALDIERIGRIRVEARVPLVLHGGSGITDDDFQKAIQAGISVIHINTELRKAWRDALALALAEKPDEVAPYKLSAGAKEAVQKIVTARLRLFAGQKK
jgi:fructose-bisphosphate aldolase class II